jgi:hypothetical protein
MELNQRGFMNINSANFYQFIYKNQMQVFLSFLLVGNFIFRYIFEMNMQPVPYYFDQLSINTANSSWYTYMLPSMAKLWGGTWSALGIGILPFLNDTIGNTATYLLLNLLFVTIAYVLSWYAFHSKILTFTVGLCSSFTTLNHHVYGNGSLVVLYVPLIFCILNMFALLKLFNDYRSKQKWWLLWFVSLLLYIASFEGWIDYYAMVIIIAPACFIILNKRHDRVKIKQLVRVISFMTIAFVLFVIFKIKYVYASTAGEEHDLVFNYGLKYWVLIVEDVISNFLTCFYSTIITYLPPQITFSNALLLYGAAPINEMQNGYDKPYTYLAATNALFLWRFYAGILASIFVFYLWKISKKLFTHFNRDYLFLYIFMMMVLFGAPAHLLVKFRAMHVMPWLPYQSFMGQIGLVLLMGYALHMLHRSAKSKVVIWAVTGAIWASIVFSGFLKGDFYKAGASYGYAQPDIVKNCDSPVHIQ